MFSGQLVSSLGALFEKHFCHKVVFWILPSTLLFKKCSKVLSWDSLLVERWTHDQKVASTNPRRSSGRFFSPELTFWLLFSVHSTPMLLQWHIIDTGHSAKSAGGRLLRNTHTPLTQSGLTLLLSRHNAGTYLEMSSHATCQGTLVHSHLNLLSHCGLVLA